MRGTFTNVIWHFPFLGFLTALAYFLTGGIVTLTVVGAPLGLGLIQYGRFLLAPGTRAMVHRADIPKRRDPLWVVFSFIIMVLWLPFGLIYAVVHILQSLGMMCTIIGIPTGLALIRSTHAIFNPVGKVCVPIAVAEAIDKMKGNEAIEKYLGRNLTGGGAANNINVSLNVGSGSNNINVLQPETVASQSPEALLVASINQAEATGSPKIAMLAGCFALVVIAVATGYFVGRPSNSLSQGEAKPTSQASSALSTPNTEAKPIAQLPGVPAPQKLDEPKPPIQLPAPASIATSEQPNTQAANSDQPPPKEPSVAVQSPTGNTGSTTTTMPTPVAGPSVSAAPSGLQLADARKAYEAGDFVTALQVIRPLAEQGNVLAQIKLAEMYQSGSGVPKDDAQALAWYTKAADQHNTTAMGRVGDIYRDGRGVTKDDKVATDWWLKGAQSGDPWSEYNLGLAYRSGKGVEKSPAQAIEWLDKAGNNNIPDALSYLAAIYRKGNIVQQDVNKSLEYSRAAAEMGHENSQYRLALAYRDGSGVPQSFEEAYKWTFISAIKGQPEPIRLRDQLAKKFSPDQLTALQQAAQQTANGIAANEGAVTVARTNRSWSDK